MSVFGIWSHVPSIGIDGLMTTAVIAEVSNFKVMWLNAKAAAPDPKLFSIVGTFADCDRLYCICTAISPLINLSRNKSTSLAEFLVFCTNNKNRDSSLAKCCWLVVVVHRCLSFGDDKFALFGKGLRNALNVVARIFRDWQRGTCSSTRVECQ